MLLDEQVVTRWGCSPGWVVVHARRRFKAGCAWAAAGRFWPAADAVCVRRHVLPL